jgi:N utilization substance protein B
VTVGSAATGGNRHRGREVALQVLYAIDLAGRGSTPLAPVDASFEGVREHFEVPAVAADFARGLVEGVVAHRVELDEIIAAHARNWRVSRMAVVDRNVLRLAVHELRDTDTPAAVVIDEAVDLARRFGADASPGFVNGVLDAIARELRAA